jgi:hypothetical protein
MNSEKLSRFLPLGALIVLGVLISSVGSVALVTTDATTGADTMRQVTVRQAADQGKPWINLGDGSELSSAFTGAAGMEYLLRHGLAQPLALAAADFDEDGVPDLIAGYAGPGGGLLTLYRGNLSSIYPNSSASEIRNPNCPSCRRPTWLKCPTHPTFLAQAISMLTGIGMWWRQRAAVNSFTGCAEMGAVV